MLANNYSDMNTLKVGIENYNVCLLLSTTNTNITIKNNNVKKNKKSTMCQFTSNCKKRNQTFVNPYQWNTELYP